MCVSTPKEPNSTSIVYSVKHNDLKQFKITFKGGVTFRSDELYLALKQSILVLSSPSFGFVLGLGALEGVPSLKAV